MGLEVIGWGRKKRQDRHMTADWLARQIKIAAISVTAKEIPRQTA
jgi:hypothetical protein